MVGQAALLVSIPFLTRAFTPGAFGVYQIGLATGLIVQPLATLRLEFVIPSIATFGETSRLVTLARKRVAGWTGFLLVAGAIVWFLDGSATFLWIAACTLFANSAMSIDNSILIRDKQINRLVARNILAGTLTATLQILSAVYFPSILALGAALLVGRLVAVAATHSRTNSVPDRGLPGASDEWTWRRGRTAAASGMIAVGSDQVLKILAGAGLGPAAAGQVGVAQQAATAPMGLISAGLAQYTQAELSPLVRSRDASLGRAVRYHIRLVAPIALLISVGLIVLGPILATPIFGPGWEAAGIIIAVLGLPAGLQVLTAPLMPLFPMLALEDTLLRLQAFRLVLAVAVAVTLYALVGGAVIPTICGYAAGNSLGYLALLVTLLSRTRTT